MRLHLSLTGTIAPVPFTYHDSLRGALHKWLGPNELHDGLSMYSFGWLKGGRKEGNHLGFPDGATWRISFHDPAHAKQVLAGIMRDPDVAFGLRVHEVREEAPPPFDGRHRFILDSPVVVRRHREDRTQAYLLWDDPGADEVLTHILRQKMKNARLNGDTHTATVRFDRSYHRAHTKLAEIKGTKHKGSICPVIVEGPPEALRFAWLVGAGELTGCGFGALR